MRYVNIEFTNPKDKFFPVFSWVIRAFQRTKYSHVRLHWKSSSGIDIVYEASGSEVKVIGEYAAKDNKVNVVKRYKVKVTNEEYRNLIRLFRFSSVKYGKLQVLGIGLAHIFGLKKNPFAQGRGSQVCSELVGLFLEQVKSWDHGLDLDIAGPLEIDKALQKLCKMYRDDIFLDTAA